MPRPSASSTCGVSWRRHCRGWCVRPNERHEGSRLLGLRLAGAPATTAVSNCAPRRWNGRGRPRSEPELGVRVELDLAEACSGLLEPTLAPAQLRCPATRAPPRSAPGRPRTGCRCASAWRTRAPLAPLRRPVEVAHALAAGDQVAAGPARRPELRDLACDPRSRRLVQSPNPFRDAPLARQRQPSRTSAESSRSATPSERPIARARRARRRVAARSCSSMNAISPSRIASQPCSGTRSWSSRSRWARASRPFATAGSAERERVPGEPDRHPRGAGDVPALLTEAVRALRGSESATSVPAFMSRAPSLASTVALTMPAPLGRGKRAICAAEAAATMLRCR